MIIILIIIITLTTTTVIMIICIFFFYCLCIFTILMYIVIWLWIWGYVSVYINLSVHSLYMHTILYIVWNILDYWCTGTSYVIPRNSIIDYKDGDSSGWEVKYMNISFNVLQTEDFHFNLLVTSGKYVYFILFSIHLIYSKYWLCKDFDSDWFTTPQLCWTLSVCGIFNNIQCCGVGLVAVVRIEPGILWIPTFMPTAWL